MALPYSRARILHRDPSLQPGSTPHSLRTGPREIPRHFSSGQHGGCSAAGQECGCCGGGSRSGE